MLKRSIPIKTLFVSLNKRGFILANVVIKSEIFKVRINANYKNDGILPKLISVLVIRVNYYLLI